MARKTRRKREAPAPPTLPRDYSPTEKLEVVEWLCTLSLPVLRKRQGFIAEQQKKIYDQWERSGPSPRLEGGADDLAVMEQLTVLAVNCVAFNERPVLPEAEVREYRRRQPRGSRANPEESIQDMSDTDLLRLEAILTQMVATTRRAVREQRSRRKIGGAPLECHERGDLRTVERSLAEHEAHLQAVRDVIDYRVGTTSTPAGNPDRVSVYDLRIGDQIEYDGEWFDVLTIDVDTIDGEDGVWVRTVQRKHEFFVPGEGGVKMRSAASLRGNPVGPVLSQLEPGTEIHEHGDAVFVVRQDDKGWFAQLLKETKRGWKLGNRFRAGTSWGPSFATAKGAYQDAIRRIDERGATRESRQKRRRESQEAGRAARRRTRDECVRKCESRYYPNPSQLARKLEV